MLGGIFAGWNFRGWNFGGWNFRGWNFPGTIYIDKYIKNKLRIAEALLIEEKRPSINIHHEGFDRILKFI